MVELHYYLKKSTKRIGYCLLLASFSFILTTSHAPTTLEEVLRDGELRVTSLAGSTTYFENAKGPNGFEYFLAKAFADSLGVKLRITLKPSLSAVLQSVGGPKANFAAAGLVVTSKRQERLLFSEPYYEIEQKVIYRSGSKKPKNIADLADGVLLAVVDSSQSERLFSLKKRYPELIWKEPKGLEMQDLMSEVHFGNVDYAVVGSMVYQLDRFIYPRARAAFTLPKSESVGWAFPARNDDSLINAANHFLRAYKESGKLDALIKKSFEQQNNFNFSTLQRFQRMVFTRLPKFEVLFREASKKYNIDRHLLAAIAYQESHWDAKAISPTGVRGLMMLTLPTAQEVGVKNRLDPKQSLEGGIKYYLKIKARLPKSIKEPDRTMLALAAYNVGLGHLEDARVLTDRAGKNPNLWIDVQAFLPLLQQKKYYTTVRHGYARGQEPVDYVKRIQRYEHLLKKNAIEQQRKRLKKSPLSIPNSNRWNADSLLSL